VRALADVLHATSDELATNITLHTRKIFSAHSLCLDDSVYHDHNHISNFPHPVTKHNTNTSIASEMPATPGASSNVGLPPNSYIYKVISTAPRQDPLTYSKTDALAIISSDDSLRFLDPATLNVLPNGILKNVNEKVTCLERANDAPSNVVATAGRDGFIRFWDKRSRQKALEIQSRMSSTHQAQLFSTLTTTTAHKLISALVCDAQRNFIAAGIENPEDGSHESPVYVW
jgi:WD40 repeat protein